MSDDVNLRKRIEAVYAFAERASASGVMPYLQSVVIDCKPEPRPFRDVAEPWQFGLAHRMGAALESVSHINPAYPGPFKQWYELPKGHDKSSMLARLVNHTLAFTRRQWTGYVAASDRDQASLLAEAMFNESRLNPWLAKRIHFKNWVVTGQHDSSIKILAADAASSQGLRGDLLIVDELTHFKDKEEPFWQSLVSGSDKRPGCVFIVITNSGMKNSWQYQAREVARTSDRWYFYHAPGRLASWMSPEQIAESRKLLPPSMAARLFDNIWSEPGDGCDYVTRAEAQACEDLGRQLNLSIKDEGLPGVSYFGAVDFGSVKDYCVCCILHKEGDRILVDRMDVRCGTRQNPVPVAYVEDWLNSARKKFNLACLTVDPYQLDWLIQKYQRLLPIEKWESRAGRANFDMAQVLRTLIINRQVAWPATAGEVYLNGQRHTLVDELSELIIHIYNGGATYRIQHLHNGHDDRTICLAMACVAASRTVERQPLYISDVMF